MIRVSQTAYTDRDNAANPWLVGEGLLPRVRQQPLSGS